MDIDGTYGSLVPPFNPPKVEELLAAALIAAGFVPPDCTPYPVTDSNLMLNVSVTDDFYTPEQIAQIVAILDAVAADPTRNEKTEEQKEHDKLNDRIEDMKTLVNTTLTDATFNAAGVTNAQKIEVLRESMLSIAKSVRYLLKMEKKRETGVFSMTVK